VPKKVFACAFLLVTAGCPSPPEKDAKYPPQPPGCPIEVFPETPRTPTDNIGPVSSSCDENISDADCMQELKNQACKLGANVVWGVEPNPTKELGKKKFFGRAAHTK